MNKLPIERVITDEDLSSVSNVFYGSGYMDKNKVSNNNLATSHNSIQSQCSNVDTSTDGLIDTTDPDYEYYKKSQFYQPDNPSNKLNAFLWYYSTGRLDNAKKNEKTDDKVMNQMKNISCQILKEKAMKVNTDTSTSSTCSSDNIYKCTIADTIKSFTDPKNWLVIGQGAVSSVFFAMGMFGFLSFMIKIFKSFEISTNGGWMVWNIIAIIIGYVISGYLLISNYSQNSNSTDTASTDDYVFIAPDTVEGFTCLNGDQPEFGCCDDGTKYKIDPVGSNCIDYSSSNNISTTLASQSANQSTTSQVSSQINYLPEGVCNSTEDCVNDQICMNGQCVNYVNNDCSNSQYGCCDGTSIEKSDTNGSNCPGCSNTSFGCCPDNNTAKIDEDGTNCSTSTSGYNDLGVSSIVWFIVCMVIGMIFFILFNLFNFNNVLATIFFILFSASVGIGINILSNILNIGTSSNLVIKKDTNNNLTVNSGVNEANTDTFNYASIGIFIVLFVLTIYFTKSNTSRLIKIIYPIIISMFSVSFVSFGFSLTRFWYKLPLIFLGITIGLRFLWNTILSLLTYKMKGTNGKNKDFIIKLNALLYNYPVEYFKKLISGENDNFKSQKLDLPSGLPWDLPGVKLIKLLILGYIFISKKDKQEFINYPKSLSNAVKYPTSNLSVSSFPFSLINLFK